MSTLKKFYGRHHNLVDPYNVAASKLVTDLMPIANKQYGFQLRGIRFLPDIHFLGFVISHMDMAGALKWAGDAHPSQTPDHTSCFFFFFFLGGGGGVHACMTTYSSMVLRMMYDFGTLNPVLLGVIQRKSARCRNGQCNIN